ncbi:MAG: GH36 C-terminal domain-containing protein, partial [Acidobacteria bacterium]|nr:GH36 C-terminal domain-containing protein [Acidobacteriota bacterium]
FYGDYYPLTPYSSANDIWMAWQFNRAEKGDGMVQIFRRAESPYEAARLALRDLEPGARYAVTDIDTEKTTEAAGKELMAPGLRVVIEKPRTAIILVYKKMP